MIGALGLIILRDWRLHQLRLVLTIAGIALGVAVFFAVRTTNTTLVNSLHTMIEKLAGKATLQVVAGESGFPQEIVARVRATSGVQYAEPVTETIATTAFGGGQKILILGLDTASDLAIYGDTINQDSFVVKNPLAFSNRKDSVAITRTLAERFGLKDGSKFTVNVQSGPLELTVRGIFANVGIGEVYDGNVAVMDIYSAQDVFGRGTNIDRIDVSNTPAVAVDELQKTLTEWLPSGVKTVRPTLRGQSLENAVSSINFGLTIMSFLALTIGVFIIFNSFSISLNQRWKEIGILRALGVERRNVRRMFLFEAALMGGIGSAIGVAAGYGLATISMRFVGDVTASFYGFISSPQELEFNVVYAGQALFAGILASLIAAWLPARSASNLDPALALHNIESRQSEAVIGRPRLLIALILVIGGLLMTRFGQPGVGLSYQLFYSFAMQLGMILLVPRFIRIGASALRPVMNKFFGAEGLIAVETMAHAPRRTSSTVIALMIGLSFAFSHASFIQSQKSALDRTLNKAVSADMLVASSNEVHSRTYHFSEATVDQIASLPDVALADPVRITSVEYKGQEVSILSHDMNSYFAISPDLLDFGDYESARASTSRGEGILVSNNFAERWKVRLGDIVTLDTPGGPLNLKVVGMLDYYRSEKGTVFIDRQLYKQYWNDSNADYIFIDLKDGADRDGLKAKIENVLRGQQKAFIYTHEEYKQWVSVIVDQFFALMYVQMVVAVFVAGLGLINTMVISVAERKRELGIFRAIGGLRRQVVKMVLLEAVAISLIGLAAGITAGLMNAYFLVNTAALIIAGFTMPLIFPMSMVLAAIPIVIAAAVVSAWFPARSASRLNVVEAIGYE